MTHQQSADRCLYARLLGDAWPSLPSSIRTIHSVSARLEVAGRARVDRGTGFLTRIIAAVFRFPPAADDIAIQVVFERTATNETWTRTFGNNGFRSIQSEGKGSQQGLLRERFGLFTVNMRLVPEPDRLRLVICGWNLLGIPLPRSLAPRGDTYEFEKDGIFNFHVEVRVPLAGLVVRYIGHLVPITP